MKEITVKFEGAVASGKTKMMAILIAALADKKIKCKVNRAEDRHTLVFELDNHWTDLA